LNQGTSTNPEQVVMLKTTSDNTLFAATAVMNLTSLTFEYSLYTVAGGVATLVGAGLDFPRKILGVASLTAGPTYFVATDSKIYTAASIAGPFTELATLSLVAGDCNGIYSDGTNLFVVTIAKGLYFSTNSGASWTHVAAPVVSSATVSLLNVAGPFGTSGKYLVGSGGYSYYTFNIAKKTLTRFPDTTIALYAESIGSILVDGTHVFMGTNEYGLWGAEFSTSTADLASGTSWVHE
jgi:hypothetical protein